MNDGGPAFGHGAENGHWCGATLRDYFAAAALQGQITMYFTTVGDPFTPTEISGIVKKAYAFADAMLKEREKRQQ